jgi:hypothetical protein
VCRSEPAFIYSAWRHGGWYVDNVHYPSGAVGCVSRNYPDRRWRIACDDRPDAFERFTYRTRDEAAGAERDLIALGILGRKSLHQGRKVTLEKLADHHEVSTAESTTAAEDLIDYLEDPESIRRWVAVTFAGASVTYLKADFEDAEQARAYVEGLIEDVTFPELPIEVYDLDTGERIRARLSIVWGEA